MLTKSIETFQKPHYPYQLNREHPQSTFHKRRSPAIHNSTLFRQTLPFVGMSQSIVICDKSKYCSKWRIFGKRTMV